MVPHFKHYLNYSQRNSNSKLGLKLETLSIGVDSPLLKGSMLRCLSARGRKVAEQNFTNDYTVVSRLKGFGQQP